MTSCCGSQATLLRPPARADMVWIPGGEFRMGSDYHYPEEAPAHRVRVDGFWMDRTLVTNAQFARFVEDTGYVTFAEIAPRAEDYPGALPEMLRPSSMVFVPPRLPVPNQVGFWWHFMPGADWRHPTGPDSTLEGLEQHPVVHVALVDVEAYCRWAGKALPTEAEWEFAAGAGTITEFAWGSALQPGGRHMANVWQGTFPYHNLAEDGFVRTSPVGAFPVNEFGLSDMIGNVWEWTQDWYADKHAADAAKTCCVPDNPRGPPAEGSSEPGQPVGIPRKVLKGGSHLCAPNYCRRYRPAARYPHPVDTSTCHVGFRCIKRVDERMAGAER